MTFIDRFTAADSTNLHGRTPSGAPNAYNVTAGSFSVQDNEAQSGSTNSTVYIDTEETNLIFSLIVRVGAESNYIRFRWDQVANTGWEFRTADGSLYYYNGSGYTGYDSFSYSFHGNGNHYYFQFDLTNPAAITIHTYNLQFVSSGWWPFGVPLTVSSSLNNDKTSVGFSTSDSGVKFDCLRCQSAAYDYPMQGLLDARIQKAILENHVPYIILSYDTGTPVIADVYSETGVYTGYYDGWHALLKLADIYGPVDGALFLEAAIKQFQITHDGYYVAEWIGTPYGVQEWRPYSEGAYELWVRFANQDAYDTVRFFPSNALYSSTEDTSHTSATPGLHRECALALGTHVWANKIGGVAASGLNTTRWNTLREWNYDWVNYWCDEITPGVYAWTGVEIQIAAFMCGITSRMLWYDYTVSNDSRFPAALLKLCNFIWNNFWLPGNSPYPGMLYDLNPDSPSYGAVGVNNDLNGLIAHAFAKCAQLTGDETHMNRADTLISNMALYGSFWSGKEKNQATTWLKDYIDWRAAFSPVRRSGRLLRRSA